MTTNSPPPTPPTPSVDILPEYVSHSTIYNGALVFMFTIIHVLLFVFLKMLFDRVLCKPPEPSKPLNGNVKPQPITVESDVERQNSFRACWLIYALSFIGLFVSFQFYWELIQGNYPEDPYDGKDPADNTTKVMSLRDSKDFGAGLDWTLVFAVTGICVANVVQLFMSGDFKLHLGGDTGPNLTIAQGAMLLAQMKWNIDRRTILLLRAIGSVLLVAAMCIRSDIHIFLVILIAGAMLIATCNILQWVLEVAFNPTYMTTFFSTEDNDAGILGTNTWRFFNFLARLAYVLGGWPCVTAALCLVYNLSTSKAHGLMIEEEDYTTAVNMSAQLIMAGCLNSIIAAIVFFVTTPFSRDPFDGITAMKKDGRPGYSINPKTGVITIRADVAESHLP